MTELSQEEILKEFEAAQAIHHGHFILSSGLHSKTYLQCARVLMNPKRADRLCAALAKKVREHLPNREFDLVVAPAMGGVVVGYEMARQMGVDGVFCERVEGSFALRRGFDIPDGARVLIVEDVVTTGKSSLETVACIESYGGRVTAEACLVDRSGGQHCLNFPVISLLEIAIETFAPDQIPDDLAAVPAIKPGSRWLRA